MADPAIPNFGPFLLVQAGLFIVTIGAGIVAWWRGISKKLAGDGNDRSSGGGGTQLFFDGPLKVALDKLEGSYRVLGEMKGENERTVSEFRERHKDELEILNRIREISAEQNKTLGQILEELRDAPPRRRR